MNKYFIGTLNNISNVGLSRLKDNYILTEDIDKANGIIVRSYKMHDMNFSNELLAIGRAGAGVNNIPLDTCSEKGIVVFNAPGANSNAVKELVISSLIMGARNIYEGISWANSLTENVGEAVEKGKKQFVGSEINGKTLGVIGLGAIGAKVANAAHCLGMNVVGYEAFKPHPCLNAPVELYDDVNDMVKVCDFISIHVPSLKETKEMINKDLISKMKDGVIILNFARPDLVKISDIVDAAKEGKVRKYLTDLPNEDLINCPNIITTPHIGASTSESEENCASMAVDEIMDYFDNGNILNSVNFPKAVSERVPDTNRLCLLYKGDVDIEEIIKSKISSNSIKNSLIAKGRNGYNYAIFDISKDSSCLDISFAGLIRTRFIEN